MYGAALAILEKLAPYIIGAIILTAVVVEAIHWRNSYAEKRLAEYRLQLVAESGKVKAKAEEDAHIAEVRSLKLNEIIEVQARENSQTNAELSATVERLNAERVRRYQAPIDHSGNLPAAAASAESHDGAYSEAPRVFSAEADRQAAEDAREADQCSESLRAAQSFGKPLTTKVQ
jgi:hypothetical protein